MLNRPSDRYVIGLTEPLPKPKLDVRPAKGSDNRPSFKPCGRPSFFK